MKFSELVDKIKEAEDKLNIDRKCLYCGGTNWLVSTSCKAFVMMGDNNKFVRENCIIMTCSHCGAKIFLDPAVLGLDAFISEEIVDNENE